MLWLLMGFGPVVSIVLDIIIIVVAVVLAGYVLRVRRGYGDWIRLANCDHIVVAIGRDRQARLICASRKYGIYLDLGGYGHVPLDGEAVYKIINVPQKNSLSFIYLPYGLLLRARELAGIKRFGEGLGEVIDVVRRVVDKDGNVYFECSDAVDKDCEKRVAEAYNRVVGELRAAGKDVDKLGLRMVEEPIYAVTIDRPEVIRPQDIVEWQEYSFNPIILKSMNESYLVEEIGAAKGILDSIWIKLLPIIGIIAVIAFIMSIIK